MRAIAKRIKSQKSILELKRVPQFSALVFDIARAVSMNIQYDNKEDKILLEYMCF